MSVGWKGKKVNLTPLEKEKHFETTLQWINDPELTEWMFLGDMPIGRLAEEEYFEQSMKAGWKNRDTIHFAVETLDGKHIGNTSLHMIDWRHGTATSGMMIGPLEFRGKGFGSDVVEVRTHYAFHQLGLRLLMSEALAENTASIKMLLKAGYKETGRITERYWKNGNYRDAVLFALHREDI